MLPQELILTCFQAGLNRIVPEPCGNIDEMTDIVSKMILVFYVLSSAICLLSKNIMFHLYDFPLNAFKCNNATKQISDDENI